MKHWSEAQLWKARGSGEILTAGELKTRYRVELTGVSLIDATFDVRAGGDVWVRVKEMNR